MMIRRELLVKRINIPIPDETILSLNTGDSVLLNGVVVTGRDAAHKWISDCFINKKIIPSESDEGDYQILKEYLNHGVIYHCGPVVSGLDLKKYHFVAAGPTTSIREETYQADVMRHFSLKGVIGKGGMGSKTLTACQEVPAVYFHAIGGAAALIAKSVKKVLGVYKLEFGIPEAIWVIEVQDFPAVVTMDSHGNSLHEDIQQRSRKILDSLLR
jgi:fumarate hydratase subunit beta